MPIEIDSNDVALAESFLENLLSQEVPEGRFTKGSALRDLTVKALAFVFAHIQKENATIRSLQSLLNVGQIAVGDPDTDRAVSNAVDAILSNWFITRNAGGFSRGMLTVEVSKRQDYIIPATNRFSYDRSRAFFPDVTDTSSNIVIRSNELVPVLSVDGVIIGYQFRLRVVAARTGTVYDVEAANWEAGGHFSPFVIRIFNDTTFSGGANKESTDEVITRSNSAVAVRNLINPRSIDAVLQEKFPSISQLFVAGMGDPEMQRDLKTEVANSVSLHVGGHFDIYTDLPRVETTFQGQLGGKFTRPDGKINVFRDTTSTSDWTAEDVQLGDVLRVSSGLSNAPVEYIIKGIFEGELRISENTPFAEATDEAGTFVSYYIYRPIFGPDIHIFPTTGVNTTGQTSQQIQTANRLVLPGGAHYDVLDVAVIDPDVGDPNISQVDGFVHFPIRTNEEPNSVIAAQFLEYQIANNDPSNAQSMTQLEELILESTYNNKTVRVTYETLSGLDIIHSFVTDRFERILAANALARGFNPAYLSFEVPYKLRATATDTIDETALRKELLKFINTFDPKDILGVSDLYSVIRNFDSSIGSVLPFNITYELILPDGRTIQFLTADEVVVDTDKISDERENVGIADPIALGLTDRTIRYITTLDRITVALQ